jgi:hypothetical protein
MAECGVKRGAPPTLAEIEQAKDSVFNPSYFGTSLQAWIWRPTWLAGRDVRMTSWCPQDIMALQEQTYPSLKLPWLVPVLCNMIIKLGGLHTEGIFRCGRDPPGHCKAIIEGKRKATVYTGQQQLLQRERFVTVAQGAGGC